MPLHYIWCPLLSTCASRLAGVTWGLAEGFVKWLLNQGYSLANINNRLSAVKVYVRLAAKAGIIPLAEHALIREVRGYGSTEKPCQTKSGSKTCGIQEGRSDCVNSCRQQLKTPLPQGIRDRLLMCLLSTWSACQRSGHADVEDMSELGTLPSHGQKTDTTDRMELTADLLVALADYERYVRKNGTLLRAAARMANSRTR